MLPEVTRGACIVHRVRATRPGDDLKEFGHVAHEISFDFDETTWFCEVG
jgi:hypothetical protein